MVETCDYPAPASSRKVPRDPGAKVRTTVGEVLAVKGHDVWSVPPDVPVYEALRLLAEKNVGALAVLEGDKLVGIFSERDYARKVFLQGKTSRDTLVRGIMTPDVIVVRPDSTLGECMMLMTLNRIRHLPVVEDGKLTGIITVGDVVRAAIGS